MNYYNEIDPYAARWLMNLIEKGLIPDGEVDTRSIVDVRPSDLAGFTQCHFFAGIGGWSHALRLAGWPDDRPIWTGSCPCQPFSVAGKGLGTDDPRHLWPYFHRLIAAVRPPVVMGEQVAGAAGYGWLDGVRADLEREDYACRGVDIPACAVDAPHIRQRLYWVASALDNSDNPSLERHAGNVAHGGGRADKAGSVAETGNGDLADNDSLGRPHERLDGVRRQSVHDADGRGERGDMADADSSDIQARGSDGLGTGPDGSRDGSVARCRDDDDPRHMADAESFGHCEYERNTGTMGQASTGDEGEKSSTWRAAQAACDYDKRVSFWSNHIWLTGADGKARRAEPSIPLLAHGVPGRVGRLRAYGNAIVPTLAAEVIKAFMGTDNCAALEGKDATT